MKQILLDIAFLKLYIQAKRTAGEHRMTQRSLLALALLASALTYGAVKGTILGTVTDPTGAVVANAKVTVRSEGTNFTREATTDASGNFTAPDLAPGTYSVTFEASGFKRAVYSGLTLRVDQKLRVDAALAVGQVVETVEVSLWKPTRHRSDR
jgi:hypothetical protein